MDVGKSINIKISKCNFDVVGEKTSKQESIPVGCVPPALPVPGGSAQPPWMQIAPRCKPPPPDVDPRIQTPLVM